MCDEGHLVEMCVFPSSMMIDMLHHKLHLQKNTDIQKQVEVKYDVSLGDISELLTIWLCSKSLYSQTEDMFYVLFLFLLHNVFK